MGKRGESLARLFGKRLREVRKQKRLSQEQLAFKAEVNTSFLGQVERGTANPSLKTVEKIAHALQTPFGELFNFSSVREDPNDRERIKDLFYSILNDTNLDRMLSVSLESIKSYGELERKSK